MRSIALMSLLFYAISWLPVVIPDPFAVEPSTTWRTRSTGVRHVQALGSLGQRRAPRALLGSTLTGSVFVTSDSVRTDVSHPLFSLVPRAA